MSAFEIYFEIPDLSLKADAELYGENTSNNLIDYTLSETTSNNYNSCIISKDILKCAFLYESVENVTKFRFTNDEKILNSLKSAINNCLLADNFKLTNPITYPRSSDPALVDDASLSKHYIQYLSSLLFTNPQTQGPLSNITEMVIQMNNGVLKHIVHEDVLDQNSNIITPGYSEDILQTLGDQFINFIKAQSDINDNNIFVQNIFEQLLAKYPERFNTTDVDPEKVTPIPFSDNDIIAFDVVISGNLSTEVPKYNTNNTKSILEMFPSTTSGLSNYIDYNNSNTTADLLVLKPQKWRLKLILGPSQDITKFPHLFSTKILNTNANTVTYNSQDTTAIYSNPSLTDITLNTRTANLNNIYTQLYFYAKQILAISQSGSLVPIGVQNLKDVQSKIIKFMELFKSVIVLAKTINLSDITGSISSINLDIITNSIKTCLKQLSLMISIIYVKDSLNFAQRLNNIIKENLIIVVSLVDIIKAILNPTNNYLLNTESLDPSTTEMATRVSNQLLINPSTFSTQNTSLAVILSVVQLIRDSLVMLVKRNIIVSSDFNNNNENKYPDPFYLAKQITFTITDLQVINPNTSPTTFVSDLFIFLEDVIDNSVLLMETNYFSINNYISTLINNTDKKYLIDALNYGAIIQNNNLVYTQSINSGTTTFLLNDIFDLVNNTFLTTNLTSQTILADPTNASDKLTIVGNLITSGTLSPINNVDITTINNPSTVNKVNLELAL